MTPDTEQAVERLGKVADDWAEATYIFSRGYKDNFIKPDETKRRVSADLRLILTALAHSEARERGLREALIFYAEPAAWLTGPHCQSVPRAYADAGSRARAANKTEE